MVIESRQQYNDLVSKLSNKTVFATAVSDDFRYHPAECDPIIITIKYNDRMVSIEFSQEENKFCFNQPITPTSVIGGAEGGIACSLTKAIFVIYLTTI